MKKVLAFLTLLISMFLFSVPGYASSITITRDGFTFEKIVGTEVHVEEYDGSEANLVIPAYVDDLPVTVIESNAFFGKSQLTSITIPSTMKRIDMSAFEECSNLTTVTFEGNQLSSISTSAFASCSSLERMVLPESITSLGLNVFEGCKSLEYVRIPAALTSLSQDVFSKCPKLKTAGPIGSGSNIEFGWTEKIPEQAFYRCTSLTSVQLPATITKISNNAFCGCKGLVSINLPDGIRTIDYSAFASCTSLASIDLPESLRTINYSAFSSCQSLTSISIPKNITYIGTFLFSGCKNLKNITLPAGMLKEISGSAFSGCTSLETLIIPEGVTTIGQYPFKDCPNLQYVQIPKSVSTISQLFNNCPQLKTAGPVGSGSNIEYGWDTSIPDKAFQYTDSLEKIKFPETLTHIGNLAFYKCVNLTDFVIPDSVTTIGNHAFSECSSLKTIILPSTLKSTGLRAFASCANLEEIYLSGSISSLGNYTFENCNSLKYVYFDGNANQWYNLMANSQNGGLDGTSAEIILLKYALPFVDVSDDAYYYNAVDWAFLNGIVNGVSATHFAPDNSCTRAQAVTFLWRTFGMESFDINNPFVDVPANTYYTDAVIWAYLYGITTGTDATHFTPDGLLTRAEFVTFLWRTQGEPKPTISNPFVDVPANTYYTDAVLWAYENGITTGSDATHFDPSGLCTRAHVVTFLYRAFGEEVSNQDSI